LAAGGGVANSGGKSKGKRKSKGQQMAALEDGSAGETEEELEREV